MLERFRHKVPGTLVVLLGFMPGWAAMVHGQQPAPLLPPAFYAVTGAPFTAQIESRTDADSSVRVSRFLRDRAGRQRVEQPVAAGEVAQTVTIFNLPDRTVIRLDAAKHTATITNMQSAGKPVAIDPAQPRTGCAAAQGAVVIGLKTIAGLEACGEKFADYELWRSTAYRMPVLSIRKAGGSTLTQQITSFTAGDPEPALFAIPAGYTIVNDNDFPLDQPPDEPNPADDVDDLPVPPTPSGLRRINGNVTPPKVLHAPEPEFSKEARKAGVGGVVLVYLQVGLDGKPVNPRVLKGPGYGLNEKALEAVRKYKFKPAMENGKPVVVELQVAVHFQLSYQ